MKWNLDNKQEFYLDVIVVIKLLLFASFHILVVHLYLLFPKLQFNSILPATIS